MLKEHGILDRSIQFGTDLNTDVLQAAKTGVFSGVDVKEYTKNYMSCGGQYEFSKYYSAAYGDVIMDKELSRNMIFSQHDLVKQSSFNEFQLIFCRNVVIYFDQDLKERVFRLLVDSLCPYGYLVLGSKESLIYCKVFEELELVNREHQVYRKKGIV